MLKRGIRPAQVTEVRRGRTHPLDARAECNVRGESIYDEGHFEDEFNQRLRFNRRGLVAMANEGDRDTNGSQFFFTLDRTDSLQGKHTIFGRVVGDTVFNVLRVNELELIEGSEKPVYPPTIRSVEVVFNPFTDIQPRITAAEKKEQLKARTEARKAAKERAPKRKGTKYVTFPTLRTHILNGL